MKRTMGLEYFHADSVLIMKRTLEKIYNDSIADHRTYYRTHISEKIVILIIKHTAEHVCLKVILPDASASAVSGADVSWERLSPTITDKSMEHRGNIFIVLLKRYNSCLRKWKLLKYC